MFVSITGSSFDSNIAGLGGAIANYDDIVYQGWGGNTFVDNIAREGQDYDDIYNASLIDISKLETLPSLIDVNISYYLNLLYDNFGVTSEYNVDRAQASTICYVDASNGDDCPGPRCPTDLDGSNWNDAYYEIQDCIDEIGTSGGEIWVAAGTCMYYFVLVCFCSCLEFYI